MQTDRVRISATSSTKCVFYDNAFMEYVNITEKLMKVFDGIPWKEFVIAARATTHQPKEHQNGHNNVMRWKIHLPWRLILLPKILAMHLVRILAAWFMCAGIGHWI